MNRISLLEPQAHNPLRAEPWSLSVGGITTLDETTGLRVTLVLQPQAPFRMRNILIRVASEALAFPWWVRLITVLFGWVAIPWVTYERFDEEWIFRWRRPAWVLHARHSDRLQRAALKDVDVEQIRVGLTGLLAGPAPASMFSAVAVGMNLVAPTCKPDSRIEVVLTGRGGPLAVMAVGEMLLPQTVQPESKS
jgi:hypothetical protein